MCVSVCVRACVHVCVCIYKEIYYEELAPVIIMICPLQAEDPESQA